MKTDAIWQAFAETGDPLYYLLYKSTSSSGEKNGRDRKKGKDAPGQEPRAED